MPTSTIVRALAAVDETELVEVAKSLDEILPGRVHRVIETEGPYAGQVMAIGLVAILDECDAIKRRTSRLPLVGKAPKVKLIDRDPYTENGGMRRDRNGS